jgi:hypothetical protein
VAIVSGMLDRRDRRKALISATMEVKKETAGQPVPRSLIAELPAVEPACGQQRQRNSLKQHKDKEPASEQRPQHQAQQRR